MCERWREKIVRETEKKKVTERDKVFRERDREFNVYVCVFVKDRTVSMRERVCETEKEKERERERERERDRNIIVSEHRVKLEASRGNIEKNI